MNLDANCKLKISSAVYKKYIAICKHITNAEKLSVHHIALPVVVPWWKQVQGASSWVCPLMMWPGLSPPSPWQPVRGVTETAAELSGFSGLATAVPAFIHILQQWEDGQGYRATEATCTEAFQLSTHRLWANQMPRSAKTSCLPESDTAYIPTLLHWHKNTINTDEK